MVQRDPISRVRLKNKSQGSKISTHTKKKRLKEKRPTHHSKSASVQSQGPDVMDTEYVFPITHLEVGFSFR